MAFVRPMISASVAALTLAAAPAFADVSLPAPYISHALDAVLLPIDGNVRDVFALAASDSGVLVLATAPGGIADANGVLPGDVLSVIGGRKIAKPLDVDTIVYYWIETGTTDFTWGVLRAGETVEVYTVISEESYWETIDVTTVETWSSYEETSFSYEEYYSEYSEEITESYESSETLIEETVTSEEFTSEVEETTEESEEVTEESEEVTEEESLAEDDMAEEGSEEEMADDATDDSSEDEAADEEAEEEPADEGDDSGDESADEGGEEAGDDAGDEGGDEGGEE
jgi:hypothetical protein